MNKSNLTLAVIVFSQFCCTSLWFAGNGVMSDLIFTFNLSDQALAHLTSAVQFGFIFGTFTFALLSIADRFSPSRVFLICAVLGSLFNLGIIYKGNDFQSIILLRMMTGFFLAGIYPVGMKIAADQFSTGLAKSLGFLVGALVLGTAFPHLAKDLTAHLKWESVMIFTSCLGALGGIGMFCLVPDGPFRQRGIQIRVSSAFKVFKNSGFRSAALGYFGHMWELYAFWAFVPMILHSYASLHPAVSFNVPLLSFVIIGVGGLACVLGGYIATIIGTTKTAFGALLISGLCCLFSPWIFTINSPTIFIGFMLLWGMVVVADSPLFSTLVAQSAPAEIKGTALTMVNCVGFFITIVSIQLITLLSPVLGPTYIYTLLSIGPLIGLIALIRKSP